MGTTFSTIQIQNPNKAPQQQFKELLCKFFEAKGLVPATEEDAQFTYWLAFNEDNGWVTLGSGGYDLGEVHSDVPEIAKDLNTRCVLTSVWDSDFLEVKLFGSSPEQNDMIVAGQPYDADMVSEGNPELWKPLL
ncbi:MAG: hypothetical protein LBR85_09765, partial [Oscillospiraceae bacterium]|nr:hypothetical protein [Oscillospiraceae bacterium]